jgi:hypothetical protein
VSSIVASVSAKEDVKISACVNGPMILASQFQDIVHRTLQTKLQLINFLARVKTWAEEPKSNYVDICLNVAVDRVDKE